MYIGVVVDNGDVFAVRGRGQGDNDGSEVRMMVMGGEAKVVIAPLGR